MKTEDTIRAFHTRQAIFWQNCAAEEYRYGTRPTETRFRTYWQSMSADSYRRARHHMRKLLDDHRSHQLVLVCPA